MKRNGRSAFRVAALGRQRHLFNRRVRVEDACRDAPADVRLAEAGGDKEGAAQGRGVAQLLERDGRGLRVLLKTQEQYVGEIPGALVKVGIACVATNRHMSPSHAPVAQRPSGSTAESSTPQPTVCPGHGGSDGYIHVGQVPSLIRLSQEYARSQLGGSCGWKIFPAPIVVQPCSRKSCGSAVHFAPPTAASRK